MISNQRHSPGKALLPVIVIVAVAASVVAALVLVGSPAQERRRWADGVRVEHLEALYSAVNRYYNERKHLPADLDDLRRYGTNLAASDPLTGRRYGYRVLMRDEFELSAIFSTNTLDDAGRRAASSHYFYPDRRLPFWKHRSGAQTFRLKAQKR